MPSDPMIVPLFWIACCLTAPETPTLISPSPYRSTENVSPDPSMTRPIFALRTPLFSTFGATRPISPAWLAVIVPALLTVAFGLPGCEKFIFPLMKALFETLAVVATSPFTSTFEP